MPGIRPISLSHSDVWTRRRGAPASPEERRTVSSEPPYGRAAMPRPDGRARRRATSDLGGRGR
eukprot:444400-Prymnesium_polylepis.1